jgi:hypothetical protein
MERRLLAQVIPVAFDVFISYASKDKNDGAIYFADAKLPSL